MERDRNAFCCGCGSDLENPEHLCWEHLLEWSKKQRAEAFEEAAGHTRLTFELYCDRSEIGESLAVDFESFAEEARGE